MHEVSVMRRRFVVMNSGGSAVPAVTLIEDIFTDADATSLNAHAIAPTNTPATAWTEWLGDWQITGNQACIAANVNRAHASCDAGIADCVISCKAASTNSAISVDQDAGVVARFSDSNNFWSVGVNNQENTFRIIERNASTQTVRASVSIAIASGTLYTIAVTLSGSTISATLDGANPISYASAELNKTSTVHGIRAARSGDRVDDFKLTTL